MKKSIQSGFIVCCLLVITAFFSFTKKNKASSLNGSWHWQQGTSEAVISFADDYCVFTSFDRTNRKFNYTWGGPYKINASAIQVTVQFNTKMKELVGTVFSFDFNRKDEQLQASFGGSNNNELWTRLDDGKAPLAGAWRISGRKQGEQITEITLAPRRTLKILSGTRFQWIAINIDTKEFFGTGGGRYTFNDGKYTEYIEFFSRDSSRVGASLVFNGNIQEGAWHHSGLSSRGEPIYEIWKRINQ